MIFCLYLFDCQSVIMPALFPPSAQKSTTHKSQNLHKEIYRSALKQIIMSKQDKKELRQQIACEWLEENYLNYGSLRHDVVGDRLQIRHLEASEKSSNGSKSSKSENTLETFGTSRTLSISPCLTWRNLTDKDINTMVCQCVAEKGVNISTNEMWTALKSDLVPAVHPLRAWLDELRPYTADQPDWIDFVASQVRIKSEPESATDRPKGLSERTACCQTTMLLDRPYGADRPTNLTGEADLTVNEVNGLTSGSEQSERSKADRLWRICFKKWFVAMVASWMKDEVVNHTVLVLVGRQGIFKTTWLDNLIPPELRAYSSKLPLSGQISKDDRLRLCENGMLNIDELDAMCGREMNIVKSLLTSTDVNERAAYGRLKERRVRLASFCASTNKREFLTDITGNRRWLPFEVESIQNPFHTIIPYERLYAQAKALVEEGIFSYWFDMEEMEVLEAHNEEFRALENEEQLLPILFDIPAEGKGEFMTTAEISDKLVTYGGIKKPMNSRKLGMLLSKRGYTKRTMYISGTMVRGWIVYQREADEIKLVKKRENVLTSLQPDNLF